MKLVTGNPGNRPIAGADSKDLEPDIRETPLECPAKLTKAQQRYWDKYVETAWWLTEHDTQKAFMWVQMAAAYQRSPKDFNAAQIAQLRVLGSELGFDPAARTRMSAAPKGKDPADRFFQ